MGLKILWQIFNQVASFMKYWFLETNLGLATQMTHKYFPLRFYVALLSLGSQLVLNVNAQLEQAVFHHSQILGWQVLVILLIF